MRLTIIAALLVAAAGCNCGSDQIAPGTYGADHVDAIGADDYRLEISGDKSEVTESFTKDGHRYVAHYLVRR
jgi:hypothetical protein